MTCCSPYASKPDTQAAFARSARERKKQQAAGALRSADARRRRTVFCEVRRSDAKTAPERAWRQVCVRVVRHSAAEYAASEGQRHPPPRATPLFVVCHALFPLILFDAAAARPAARFWIQDYRPRNDRGVMPPTRKTAAGSAAQCAAHPMRELRCPFLRLLVVYP